MANTVSIGLALTRIYLYVQFNTYKAMKHLKILSLILGFIALMASCSKEEPAPPTPPAPTPKPVVDPEIVPSAKKVELGFHESKAISLSGGNGTYTVEGKADFLEFSIDAKTKTLNIKAKRSGKATLTVKSGKQSVAIEVNVPTPKAVGEGKTGLYDEAGEPIIKALYQAVRGEAVWMSPNSSPTKNLVVIPYLPKQEEGAMIQITLKGKGLPEILTDKGEITLEAYVEISTDVFTQLFIPAKKWRLVTPTKKAA